MILIKETMSDSIVQEQPIGANRKAKEGTEIRVQGPMASVSGA